MPRGDTIKDIAVKRCPECGARFAETAGFCPFDGMTLSMSTIDPNRDRLVGTCIDNRYEVETLLGEGGMGSVYEVRHTTLDRHFAMKVLKRDLANDEALAERFHREAKATAAVKHPAVVQINDFGKLSSGEPYFVMEKLEGETLATRIRARGPMSPRNVVKIARQICSALEATHAAGVIHRDLKPENVFLVGKSEEIRIVDFGAAKVIGSSKMTRPGVVFGTPYYMSPEQASGLDVDGRADIYSLGVLMYEMITGAVPFEADTYMGVLTKHMFAEPISPSKRVAPGVLLGDLEAVVLRALAKDPSARYPSMHDLSEALETALERRASNSPPPNKTAAPRLSTADRIEQSVARRVEQERKRLFQKVAITMAGVVSVALFVVAIILWLVPPKHTEVHPETAGAARIVAPTATTTATTTATETAHIDSRTDVPPPPPPEETVSAVPTSAPPNVAPPVTTPVKKPPPVVAPPTVTTSTPPPKPPSGNDDEFADPWTRKR